MTFSKMVPSTQSLTVYLENQNKPEDGFRVSLANVNVKLTVEDAKELAEYIWVRLPDTEEPDADE